MSTENEETEEAGMSLEEFNRAVSAMADASQELSHATTRKLQAVREYELAEQGLELADDYLFEVTERYERVAEIVKTELDR